jgi:hypothetical protein
MPTLTPIYPLHRPNQGDDSRFTIGLTLDVAAVLHRHGYPRLTTGADLLRLQLALFNVIYREQP